MKTKELNESDWRDLCRLAWHAAGTEIAKRRNWVIPLTNVARDAAEMATELSKQRQERERLYKESLQAARSASAGGSEG